MGSPRLAAQVTLGQEPIPIGCTALKPVERHGWEAFSYFMYDKDTGAIMGRTLKSWLLITIFYIIYYACLAGFWALMLVIFFTFIDEKTPYWQKDYSRIQESPGMGIRPAQTYDHVDSAMIIFNKDREADFRVDKTEYKVPGWKGWADRSALFLEAYKPERKNPSLAADCSGMDADTLTNWRLGYNDSDAFCYPDTDGLRDFCGPDFGYKEGSPCVIVKLNKIFDLEHDYYETKEAMAEGEEIMVEEIPQELTKRMEAATLKKQVWVSCAGENPADTEGMGKISYWPQDGGFPFYHFPYLNQKNYVSPLVAIKFDASQLKIGQLLHVQCRAWAGNIKYSKREKGGLARFELIVHDTLTAGLVESGKTLEASIE